MFMFLLVSLLGASLFLPFERLMVQTLEWSRANPAHAAWLVGGSFFVCVLLVLPVSPVVMLAGFLFGLVDGFALMWIAGLFASSSTFLLSRTLARPQIEHFVMTRPKFKAVDRAIGKGGFRVALLIRLAMILPYAPVNYSLGVSRLSFRDYFAGTSIGVVPSFLMFVYLGTTVGDFALLISGDIQLSQHAIILSLTGLAVLATTLWIIVRASLKELRENLT